MKQEIENTFLDNILEVADGGGKCAAKKIRICKEITFDDMVLLQYAWATKHENGKRISVDRYEASSSGYGSKSSSFGDFSKASTSGENSIASSHGAYSKASVSGGNSKAFSSGTDCAASSSGNNSQAISSGYRSKAASSGDGSLAECDTEGFACVAGRKGYVRGNEKSALSLGYTDRQGRNRIAVAYVGENGIKPGTWYTVNRDGEFQEVEK